MRFFVLLILPFFLFAQSTPADSVIIIPKSPEKGFHHDYILFIPKRTPLHKRTFLLVEPNNTGKLSDSISVHMNHAIALASVSSVGNNVSTEMHLPFLVPVFMRPASQPLLYTHALDRDVMEKQDPEFKRLDLQLLAMIDDARTVLKNHNILIEPKFLMCGFSASATFTNRFSMIHPQKIKALSIGGFNGLLMLPQQELDGAPLNYPLGTNGFEQMFGEKFDIKAFSALPQFIYMGALDNNDAVDFDDAYSDAEKMIVDLKLNRDVQPRFAMCQEIYRQNGIMPVFTTYDDVGHGTTGQMNLETIRFFMKQIADK